MSIVNNLEQKSDNRSLLKESIEMLEWSILKKHLSSFSSTKMGMESILEQEIPSKLEESQNLLNETIEMSILDNKSENLISFEGVFDINQDVETCSKGGVISAECLMKIADTLSAARKLKELILNFEESPVLSVLVENLIEHQQLEKNLKNGIEKNGRISERASVKLGYLRGKLNNLKNERRKILDLFIQRNTNFLQDSIIGDRFGRPVLAIKVNFSNQFKGIIHDSSASGNTIFLEPDSVIAKGNQIASLNAQISNEEFKLLKEWSNKIAENQNTLISLSRTLLKLENALTRSRYSNWIKGNPPNFKNHTLIQLNGFVHPILFWEYKNKNTSIPSPIDFYINRNTKVVSITGPNTGGKTASLKGLGIALLMARFGLFVPSNSIPILPYFQNIFVDIGDKQSLEGNLSTFSGHISRIKKILDSLKFKRGLSLVLLDEIGSGTDPTEGTALAIALLKEFANKSDLTIATTHYGELKVLKYKDSRFENVSVSFDDDLLKPTYQLNWGIPGRSNALSISKRIGIDETIINKASDYLKPKETENINKIIKGLEEQRIRQQTSAEAAAELIARTEILYEELKRNYEYQKLNAEKFQAKEREKLTKSIKEAKLEVVKLIEKLRSEEADGEDSRKIGLRLKEIENDFKEEKRYDEDLNWKPKVGDLIRIKNLNTTGKIVESDEKGLCFRVKCGVFNSFLSINDIEGINGEKPNIIYSKIEIKNVHDSFIFSKIRTTKNTIDVRGLRVHEAEIVIEEKIRNFHGPFWIIHGIGTGKLKKGLRLWLSDLDYVEKVEDASHAEGGGGCSIAWIK